MIKPEKCNTSALQFIVGHFERKMCATNIHINNFGLSKKYKTFLNDYGERMKITNWFFLVSIFG